MTETSYPFDLGAGSAISATQWRAMARRWRGSGVNKGDQNGLAVAAGTGLQTTVASGSGFVIGHFYNNDASLPLAHSAADATFARLDLVVLELDLTDLNAPAINAVVVTGTPSGSPALPSLTQSSTIYQIPLAQVAVAALATSVGTVTDLRPWAGTRPRITNGVSGGTATTSSTTYVDMTTMDTGSFYSDGGDLLVRFSGAGFVNSAGGIMTIGVAIDAGTEVFLGQLQSDSASQTVQFSAVHLFESVAAGFHRVKMRWLVGNAAHTASMNNSRRLIVEERL
jgi:hypothetical protein